MRHPNSDRLDPFDFRELHHIGDSFCLLYFLFPEPIPKEVSLRILHPMGG